MVTAIIAAVVIPWAAPVSFARSAPDWRVGQSGTVKTTVVGGRVAHSTAWTANFKYRDRGDRRPTERDAAAHPPRRHRRMGIDPAATRVAARRTSNEQAPVTRGRVPLPLLRGSRCSGWRVGDLWLGAATRLQRARPYLLWVSAYTSSESSGAACSRPTPPAQSPRLSRDLLVGRLIFTISAHPPADRAPSSSD